MAANNFIIKIAALCNLNCSYCYMFNMGDTTFLKRPKVMAREVALQTLERIYGYARRQGVSGLKLVLHGGEPMLAGKEWIGWFLTEARRRAPEGVRVEIGMQTNATLLDRETVELFKAHGATIGISMDGPPEQHDRYRVDHAGRGSYARVRQAIELMAGLGPAAPGWGVLVVANPEFPGVEIYRHFLQLGITWMDFLWPDYHHDLLPPWPAGALARYYIELFDAWYEAGDPRIHIRWFETVMQSLLTGRHQLDALGPHPLEMVVVETDGSIEPLDVIRTCGNGMTQLGLNVATSEIEELYENPLFDLCVRNQELLPLQCRSCPVYAVCGGGYMPHRFSHANGFANPSVHCADLLAVISHIAERLRRDLAAHTSPMAGA
ncbi:MAG: radical SAM protein [Bacillota bacterium]